MLASPSAVRSSWGDWLYRAGVVFGLGGCFGMLGIDLYREARTEQDLAGIQRAGGFYMRKDGSRWRPVIGIDLDATTVDDTGAVRPRGHVTDETLLLVGRFAELQVLSLDGADLTDAGLFALRGLKALERLNLSRTPLTDVGLSHVKALARLREIDLRGTRVTPEGVGALRRTLPMAEILADEP
jgi:hypothetical protein